MKFLPSADNLKHWMIAMTLSVALVVHTGEVAANGFASFPLAFLSAKPSTTTFQYEGHNLASRLRLDWTEVYANRIVPYNGAVRRYHPFRSVTSRTSLLATKKRSGSSSSTSTSSSKKIQVKLLKHMAGIGQAGDVVQVPPAFYQNKLRPTQSAVMVTDEQVNEDRRKAKEQEEALHQMAMKLKERFSDAQLDSGNDASITPNLRLVRKAGPGGQLFGGIGAKSILDELKHILITENKQAEASFLDQKTIKVLSITDVGSGEKLEQIKHVGSSFLAKIALTKDVSVDLRISVEAEH